VWFKLKTTLGAKEAQGRPNVFVKKGFVYDGFGFRVPLPCWLAWLRSNNAIAWRDEAIARRSKLYGYNTLPATVGGTGTAATGAAAAAAAPTPFARPTVLPLRKEGSSPATLQLRKVVSAAHDPETPGDSCSDFDADPDEEAELLKKAKKIKRDYYAARRKDPNTPRPTL